MDTHINEPTEHGSLSFEEWLVSPTYLIRKKNERKAGKDDGSQELIINRTCPSSPLPQPESFSGSLFDPWTHWKSIGSPKTALAPMIGVTDAAFRQVCRNHGVELCYMPMIHVSSLIFNPVNIKTASVLGDMVSLGDRPIVLQLAGNDPDEFRNAVTFLKSSGMTKHIDYIDINLGCSQPVAGIDSSCFGSVLTRNWPLCYKIVRAVCEVSDIPVSVKTRIQKSQQATEQFVKMLVSAGAQLVCVHARPHGESRTTDLDNVDWYHMKAVVEAVRSVPIVVNGGILTYDHHLECIEYTKCACTMSGSQILKNVAVYETRTEHPTKDSVIMVGSVGVSPCDNDEGDGCGHITEHNRDLSGVQFHHEVVAKIPQVFGTGILPGIATRIKMAIEYLKVCIAIKGDLKRSKGLLNKEVTGIAEKYIADDVVSVTKHYLDIISESSKVPLLFNINSAFLTVVRIVNFPGLPETRPKETPTRLMKERLSKIKQKIMKDEELTFSGLIEIFSDFLESLNSQKDVKWD